MSVMTPSGGRGPAGMRSRWRNKDGDRSRLLRMPLAVAMAVAAGGWIAPVRGDEARSDASALPGNAPAAGRGGGPANGWRWDSVGARVAISATRINERFIQAEAYSRWDAPCRLELGREWRLRTGVDVALGGVGREGAETVIGTVGTVFTLGHARYPLEMVTGIGITGLGRDEFGGVDFGMPLQFTSHLGFNANLSRHWAVGYRFQHMSNGSLSRENPGLDMHSCSVSYRF